jgi:membrane-associated HD superfamily phosphohydrolase
MRPFWSMLFAFSGGLASAFVVLGLVPVFETVGFVTEYRLMELANLNHPLLRQLMLRAPGSYHHSVIVGTLAEAGAEAIGANALVAKSSLGLSCLSQERPCPSVVLPRVSVSPSAMRTPMSTVA